MAVIAEFKQSSPSRGVIASGLKPEEVAEQYAASGASCISVLTEEQFFGGRIGYLERMGRAGLPLIRKDFIFHQLQVMETASTPASALLLIVRLTPDARTPAFSGSRRRLTACTPLWKCLTRRTWTLPGNPARASSR